MQKHTPIDRHDDETTPAEIPVPVRDYSLDGLSIKGDIPLAKVVAAVKNFRKMQAEAEASLPDRPRMNLLLWGPPGTGKTEFVNYLGQQLGCKVVVKMASDLLDHWVGKTEKAIRAAFEEAEEDYYVRTTQADDLYWLIHIIYAEAHHESLAGQIGVGNVVLNRVANDEFPATIMAVVLDREHTIQFTPVGTGAVTAEPDEKATIAAYLCLEGFNTAGDALYFVNPVRGDASWFVSDLTKVCTIGNHVFYK